MAIVMTPFKLQEILKKWRKQALKKAHSFSYPAGGSRQGGESTCQQTRRSISMPSLSSGSSKQGAAGGSTRPGSTGKVPAGHLAVCVGEERRRFVIKMWYLSHPLFRALLKKTEEEIGFRHEGALSLPCPVPFFEHLLRIIGHSKPHHHNAISSLRRLQENFLPQTAAVDDQQLHEELLLQLLQCSSDQLDSQYSRSPLSKHHTTCGVRSDEFYKHSVSRSASQLPAVVV